MWRGRSVAVVVPARDESERLPRVVRRLPDWVDHVVVVDDGSTDGTGAAARSAGRDVVVVRHPASRGVGAAIVTGYRRALALGADVLVVMAGDDQMDPLDLPVLLEPVCLGAADYVKGNRFLHPDRRDMPAARRIAGKVLAAATRRVTGLSIDDSQCGYTALSADAARALALEDLWQGYGYPNDLLALLAAGGLRVAEVPVRPVYAGEKSGIRPWHAGVVLFVLARRLPLLVSRAVGKMGRRAWTEGCP